MARPTKRRLQDNLDSISIGNTSLPKSQAAKRRILQREFDATGDPQIGAALREQDKITQRIHNARTYGAGGTRKSQNPKPGQRKDFQSPEGFNECGITEPRSYASRAGARLERKQEGFPDVMRHPATIGIAALPLAANLKDEANLNRPGMTKTFKQLSYGHQVTGGFHINIKTAAQIAEIFPPEELPVDCDPVLKPDELFAYLHWHGIVADPYLTKQEIRRVLKDAFPGKKRVAVAKVQAERKTKNGLITHGAQGYLEYAMMDKTECNLPNPDLKKEAIIALAKLSTTWGKRSRSYSTGKPLSVTGVEIDPDRVAELELMERLDQVKKNWKNLSYAERFLHLWMSGAIAVIRKKPAWTGMASSFKNRVRVLWALLGKWSKESPFEQLDFMGFFQAALE